jgi:hypothetical protein
LSHMWVPHFRARHGDSLKDLNLDTTSVVKPNVSLSSDEIRGNTLTSVNHSSYEERE